MSARGPADLDAALRRALVRERAVLTGAGLLLALIWLALLLGAEHEGADWLGLLGLGLLLAVPAVLGLDAWRRLPRPAPRTADVGTGPATVLTAGRAPFVAMAVGALGLSLLALSFVVAGLADVADGRRLGVLVYAVVPVAPLVLAWALLAAARPPRLAVGAGGLALRSAVRTRTVPWEAVTAVVPTVSPGGQVAGSLSLSVSSRDAAPLVVPTRQLDATLWVLQAWLRHYLDAPQDRRELGHPAALQRLETVEAAMSDPAARPAWFAPAAGHEGREHA